jgi:hypothetical protein
LGVMLRASQGRLRYARRPTIVSQTMRQILAVCSLLMMAAVVASCDERPEAFYSDAAAARAAGTWIPNWLPKSARDIHELHDIDTNQSLLAFSFDPAEGPVLTPSCTQIQNEAMRPPRFKPAWWPMDVPSSSLTTDRHTYYRCHNGAYVAVSIKDGQLYHWRP